MGGCQSLHQVVRQGSLETLRITCARARNINITEQVESLQVRNPILATAPGNLYVAVTFFKQRWSAIQLAAWLGKDGAIEILAEFGANVNLADDVRFTVAL